MANPLSLIIQREYFERVRRKSFIITTILMPILMLAIMAAPTFFMFLGSHDKKVVTVLDNTHEIGSRLQSNDEIEFKLSDGTPDQLRADEDNEAILVIGNNVLSDSTSTITLLSRGAIPMMMPISPEN